MILDYVSAPTEQMYHYSVFIDVAKVEMWIRQGKQEEIPEQLKQDLFEAACQGQLRCFILLQFYLIPLACAFLLYCSAGQPFDPNPDRWMAPVLPIVKDEAQLWALREELEALLKVCFATQANLLVCLMFWTSSSSSCLRMSISSALLLG